MSPESAVTLVVYQFPRADVSNDHTLDGFKPHKFILSQFWRPGVQSQGVSRVLVSLKALGENCFLTLAGSNGTWCPLWQRTSSLSASVFTWPTSLCMSISNLCPLPFLRPIIGLGAHSKSRII